MLKPTLKVAGRSFEAWESLVIQRSMDSPIHSFSFSSDGCYAGLIKAGSACQVLIGRDAVITGFVDRVSHSLSASSHSLTIQGRSQLSDMQDSLCSVPTSKSFPTIIEEVGEFFGVSVRGTKAILATPVEKFEIHATSPLGALQRLAREQDCLLLGSGGGALEVKTKEGIGGVHLGTLKEGENILSIAHEADASPVFHEYLAEDNSEAEDERLSHRKRIYQSLPRDTESGTQVLSNLAGVEKKRRGASLDTLSVVVLGWEYREGRHWYENTEVLVKSPTMNIHKSYLISAVKLTMSLSSGQTTTLTLKPKEAYL